MNGDGVDDLILFAPRGDGPGNSRPSEDDIYVFFGGRVFPPVIDLAVSSEMVDVYLYGTQGKHAPLPVQPSFVAQDFDRDGFLDLVFYDPVWGDRGRVVAVHGRCGVAPRGGRGGGGLLVRDPWPVA